MQIAIVCFSGCDVIYFGINLNVLIKLCFYMTKYLRQKFKYLNPLSANPEKWSNTLKQIVGNLPTICLSVFDHFVNLALKGLRTERDFIVK